MELIATGKDIFSSLSKNNSIVLVPTHDIELTGSHSNDSGCYYSSRITYSTDQGETWISLCHEDSGPCFSAIIWPSPAYGFACNGRGEIYKITRTDAGINDFESDRMSVYPNPATLSVGTPISLRCSNVSSEKGRSDF